MIEKANCVQTGILHNAFALSDVFTDCILIVLPIFEVSPDRSTPKVKLLTMMGQVWKLHLPTNRKFAVTGVFLLGAM